jgi:hypothetical protein
VKEDTEDRRTVTVGWLLEVKRVLENANVQTPTYRMGVQKVWQDVQEKLKPCAHDVLGHHCQKCGECGVTILMMEQGTWPKGGTLR